MRAALLEAPNTHLVIVDDVEIAKPEGRQILVRVSHCGVCHSDLHVIDGGLPGMRPTVLGHEAAGVIERDWRGRPRSSRSTRSPNGVTSPGTSEPPRPSTPAPATWSPR